MARFRLSLRSLMLVTAVVAVGFATLGVATGSVVSAAALVLAVNPRPVPWRTLELAATLAWLLAAVVVFSDVADDPVAVRFVALGGGALTLSWALRMTVSRKSPGRWAGCLLVPVSGLLAFALWASDWDFRLRLALSEPALRSEARAVRLAFPSGPPHLCGLFWLNGAERQGSLVRWASSSASPFPGDAGLALLPRGSPPPKGYRLEHVAGPWWRFRRAN